MGIFEAKGGDGYFTPTSIEELVTKGGKFILRETLRIEKVGITDGGGSSSADEEISNDDIERFLEEGYYSE